jgi:hypothetical protein
MASGHVNRIYRPNTWLKEATPRWVACPIPPGGTIDSNFRFDIKNWNDNRHGDCGPVVQSA